MQAAIRQRQLSTAAALPGITPSLPPHCPTFLSVTAVLDADFHLAVALLLLVLHPVRQVALTLMLLIIGRCHRGVIHVSVGWVRILPAAYVVLQLVRGPLSNVTVKHRQQNPFRVANLLDRTPVFG